MKYGFIYMIYQHWIFISYLSCEIVVRICHYDCYFRSHLPVLLITLLFIALLVGIITGTEKKKKESDGIQHVTGDQSCSCLPVVFSSN